jgi:uncharacterized protein (UPF0335 family)
MADKLTAKSGSGRLDRQALKRCIADINKHKEKAAEYIGQAGQATKNAVESHNFDKKALTFVAGLARKEADQQLATLGAIITYAEAMGMFDQMDMFNDAINAMKAVIENASKGTPGKAAGASNVAALAAAAAH